MDDVRPAEPADLPLLADVEAAGDRVLVDALGCDPALFTTTPGEDRADEPGFLLVVGRPVVGFAQVQEHSGSAHLQQLVVHPGSGRRGLGTALVEACCAEAARRGHDALTLTTYAEVAFNRPFYERLGFAVVERPRGVLADHLRAEAAYAALSPRVAMSRPLGGPGTPVTTGR